MKKELAHKILRETDNYYYFFDKAGFFRRISKNNEKTKILVRCNVNHLIEKLFNKEIDNERLKKYCLD